MGVAGAGKTTVAAQLAFELGWEFLDADSFHSPANVAKMQAGLPLDDADRGPWLASLRAAIEKSLAEKRDLALACSALKRSYREQLVVSPKVKFVYLKGTREVLRERLQRRAGHFMTEQLLESQFQALEEPSDAITADIQLPLPEIVAEIVRQLGLR